MDCCLEIPKSLECWGIGMSSVRSFQIWKYDLWAVRRRAARDKMPGVQWHENSLMATPFLNLFLLLNGPSGLPKAIDSGRMCRRHFAEAMRLLQGCLGSWTGCLWLFWMLDSRCCRFVRAECWCMAWFFHLWILLQELLHPGNFNKKFKFGELRYRPRQDPRLTKRSLRSLLKEPPLIGTVSTLRP